ncbi:hypothetical protein CVT26_008451 [Gymnopilus dilepis]|uniref:Cytochrome P450 n=1 Tax=Gymnopilus dilepis TaxID=231916 RepID=A0A409XXD5_9AGAR|nr:hypothetical protein CVT26_008451 [Gymnopilus dilepis]
MIILNSAQACIDLLEKRSAIYSDRAPSDVMMLMGWENDMAFFPYGKRLNLHRKMLTESFNHEKCKDYLPYQTLEATRLVQRLLANPEKFDEHINLFATAVILRIDYGHDLVSRDDPYYKVVSDAGYCSSHCAPPGSNLVDLLPISSFMHFLLPWPELKVGSVKYLPSWFPGTYPATQARFFRPVVDLMHDYTLNEVKRQLVSYGYHIRTCFLRVPGREAEGTAKESFLLTHLEGLQREGKDYPYSVEDIKGAGGVIYAAGADTTWSTILIFVLAMVLYPEAQAEAQDEIDRVIGPDRLPEFQDRTSLPYLECLVQETYRWNNAVPIGVPHRSMADDIYNGMFIPKGSVVVANTRGITLDEDIYQNPRTFDPSRYLRGEPYPTGQFGFGRRICPGRYLADSSVWIAIASILAEFTISPLNGVNGAPILPKEEFISGITRYVENPSKERKFISDNNGWLD